MVTDAEAEAPDSIHYHVLSPGSSDYQTSRAGQISCTLDKGGPVKCLTGQASSPFELDYMDPSTAFQFGRREVVDGEMTQVLLFYNPSQPAWYAWWIGVDTGYLRRQAMVAAGHFMLTHFSAHNEPVSIEFPPQGPH